MNNLALSRYKLETFLNCQRRFQLRYVHEMAWPSEPLPQQLAQAFEKGELFHRLLEQYFLGMPIELTDNADADVADWWRSFLRKPPLLPDGKRYPELGLSVPIAGIDGDGGHYLFGRFDLLILSETQAHIFDWKTERKPRTEAQLAEDWQTRLYMTMLVEGSKALGFSYQPDQVAITYWFAQAPEKSVTLRYSRQQHARNWAELKATVERIDRRLAARDAEWPLTNDLTLCQRCEYRNFCGREDETPSERSEVNVLEAREEERHAVGLEPVPTNTI